MKDKQNTPRPPYSLVIMWQDGRETVQSEGHSPSLVLEAESHIARNLKAIKRIEFRDLDGCLQTLWDAKWR